MAAIQLCLWDLNFQNLVDLGRGNQNKKEWCMITCLSFCIVLFCPSNWWYHKARLPQNFTEVLNTLSDPSCQRTPFVALVSDRACSQKLYTIWGDLFFKSSQQNLFWRRKGCTSSFIICTWQENTTVNKMLWCLRQLQNLYLYLLLLYKDLWIFLGSSTFGSILHLQY